ncbi:MAG TPA: alpha/beta family hydrolase [Candidatus Binatia bacterium]|nr:alpha/beta family hydrolase [Candidatus Binatia bacterium]
MSARDPDTRDAPVVLLAPGAGAPSTSPWMRAWAERLAAIGSVEALDYAYVIEGRKSPDRLPVLVAAHRAALERARERHGRDRPVVLAGKSMGGRVGCHLACELAGDAGAPAALVCFGYPLVAAGSGKRRDAVLLALATPVLFVQGTRDPLCPLDDLAGVRRSMTAPSELFVVEGGDHSLVLRKKDEAATGRSQAEWDAAVLAAVRTFVARHLP